MILKDLTVHFLKEYGLKVQFPEVNTWEIVCWMVLKWNYCVLPKSQCLIN